MVFHKLSILVPVYNEVATVEELLRRVTAVRFPIDREIVVVDDGSSDGSREVLEPLARRGAITLIAQEANGGKGAAIRTALTQATGELAVVQDADLELDPADLPALLDSILAGETEICYGSRFLRRASWSIRRRPTYWANLVLNALSNLLNGLKLTDFNTCYKMMPIRVMRRLRLTEDSFALEPEITAKLVRCGYRIRERPVRYEPRTTRAGKKIRLVDLFRYLAAMFRYRFFWFPESPCERVSFGSPLGRAAPRAGAGSASEQSSGRIFAR